MINHLNIKIYGQVQGVFFRYSAKDKADGSGVTGFARNEPDGTVYIEAEGEKESLDKFLEWCQQGPGTATVRKVDFEYESEIKKFKNFLVE